MSSQSQASYIADLAVLKTKEFKEVKELLAASGIVKDSANTVMGAQTLGEITNALTDLQASQLIAALLARETPKRERSFSPGRVKKTVAALDDITRTIDSWDFS